MPIAHVDDTGTQFFYKDSGVPILKDKPYTTLVLVHGFGFNSHIFHRLLPLAAASHMRLILLNRRGYCGSTPYDEDETSPIDPSETSEDEVASPGPRSTRTLSSQYMTFLQHRGAEMARFLACLIDNEKIPPRSDDSGRVSGGISLLGWSLGNVTTLSLLAFANTFDPGLIRKLEGHLRKVVIYDPPHYALGYPTPDTLYNPLFDPEIPAEQRQSRYGVWVSSYFVHSPSIREPEVTLRECIDEFSGINPLKMASVTTIPPVDMAASREIVNPSHGDAFSLVEHAYPVHKTVRIRAIFGDYNETSLPIALPKVDISYVWCTESTWETVLAMRFLQDEISAPLDHHYLARSVKFIALEGGNHFAHYEDPLQALATFAQAIE